ncbi:hypothetical protein B5K11_09835 [Rhizobium leguminosarum bv. trifolii]|uniref:hypothetical protein n=1 Tax=Rhizobium leguminosarum TaxID=384 RepID=UPI000E2FB04F|nr:hypothetical protein [Rhizobium leguminosarum]RFB95239.1 hypothetical protein B5K11_09835 [Rhizobium leguminosarum bv. trifolii]
METHDIVTYAGVFFGGIVTALIGYFRKRPMSAPAVANAAIAGIGMELGNRAQIDALISEVKRCADSLAILADRKQASFEDKLNRLIEDLEEKEREDRRRG